MRSVWWPETDRVTIAYTFSSRMRSLKVRRIPRGVNYLFRPMSCDTLGNAFFRKASDRKPPSSAGKSSAVHWIALTTGCTVEKPTVSIGPYPHRPIRVGLSMGAGLVVDKVLDAGSDVTLGTDLAATLVIPGWREPNTLFISKGVHLHLAPGMRLNMCDEVGGNHVVGTFDEVQAAGITSPIEIPVSRLVVQLRGIASVFIHFLET